jgi:glutaredoxin
MAIRRKVEIFSAGCPACSEVIEMVNRLACPSCEVIVHDMNDNQVAIGARNLGIRTVPAVLIDGRIADCCVNLGPDETVLRAAGLGKPIASTS